MTRFRAPLADRALAPEGERSAVRLLVRGQVQGIGFRPFVFRLAQECGLAGNVRNSTAGVEIELEGPPDALAEFQERLFAEAPASSEIAGFSSQLIVTSLKRGNSRHYHTNWPRARRARSRPNCAFSSPRAVRVSRHCNSPEGVPPP